MGDGSGVDDHVAEEAIRPGTLVEVRYPSSTWHPDGTAVTGNSGGQILILEPGTIGMFIREKGDWHNGTATLLIGDRLLVVMRRAVQLADEKNIVEQTLKDKDPIESVTQPKHAKRKNDSQIEEDPYEDGRDDF